MGNRGTKKKPTALKIIQGTARKDRISVDEPKPDLLNKIPPPPVRFSVNAKKIWKETCQTLLSVNLLTRADMAMVEEYVYWKDLSVRAEKEIRQNGEVCTFVNKAGQEYMTESPWVKIKKDASDRVLKIGVQFGFTPSSRTGIKVTDSKQLDPLAQLLKKKQG